MTKFVVVAGGVISGVGKGVTTASLGKILTEYGFSTTLIKIDPYINCDAGTMRPTEHGEVWVTEDGGESDQDLGTYERFLNQDIPKKNNITTGQIYKAVIDRERSGGYLGQTVQFIPHIPEEIVARIQAASQGYDVAIIEIGGTVGDYENIPFLCGINVLERTLGRNNVAYVLVAYAPVPVHLNEIKTKPVQQAIKELNKSGIFPDFIVCRSHKKLDDSRKQKIEQFSNIAADRVISSPDLKTIYESPLYLEEQGIGKKLLHLLDLTPQQKPDWSLWATYVNRIKKTEKKITIGIVGKYLGCDDGVMTDSYFSIEQALIHAGVSVDIGIKLVWLHAQDFENDKHASALSLCDGVIVPGGFGNSGVEGKIAAITHVRKNNIPYLGICYGMQLAVVEYARIVCGLVRAHTTEVDEHTPHPVVDILPLQKEFLESGSYGGTMRLGAYAATLQKESLVYNLYHKAGKLCDSTIVERHRHRYEVNPTYVEMLKEKGLIFSGKYTRSDGTELMEFLELKNHPFFVATQAHPEFKSRLGNPSPLFTGFIHACLVRQQEQGVLIKKDVQKECVV